MWSSVWIIHKRKGGRLEKKRWDEGGRGWDAALEDGGRGCEPGHIGSL